MTEAEANRATVARLVTVLSGHARSSGTEFMAPDVVARGLAIQRISVWIRYIRTRGRDSTDAAAR